ncbi:FkbM family methyltransferase [Caballeronia novacaledonica]|uniref:FkbM family methyltransferase n=1 Tax=Caballeronia novacaledonica TaxID=1544861 RepID=A0AA37MH57_9BURK|nr:FkbM family methyltransferase [Caballeronia novacaledonica]GJH26025.1 FkbM family methyltransferase [Caballeronia novacaledonica]
MQEIPTRYGVLEAFNPDEDLISRWLARYGEWAQLELAFVAGCLSEDAKIADIGAFLGTFGLGISKLKPVGKICFVDANPVVVPLLRRNVERNLNAPSVVVQAVVGGDGAQLQGTGVPGNMGSFSVANGDATGREAGQCSTESVSLRSLSEEHGPFDLYKIDAEGMEGTILRQDLEFLAQTQSTFWLECNSTFASLDVAQFLLDQGFKVFYFAFPAVSRENFNRQRDREFPYAYEAGLWASKTRTPTISKELVAAGCAFKEIANVQALRDALWLTPRWSPAGWENRSLHEVVALATHALLGEDFETFLSSAGTDALVPRWADPLPVRLQQRIDTYEQRLAEAERTREQFEKTSAALQAAEAKIHDNKALIRAHEIVLHKERERSRSAIKGLEKELLAMQAQSAALGDQLSQVYRSRSWRMTMPVRMFGRLARGDYRELRRLIKAKFFAS